MLPLPPGLRRHLQERLPLAPAPPPVPPVPPTPPFGFVPRRLRLGAQHPLLEDGDVHRHLYLQGVLSGLTEVAERPKVSAFSCHTSGCCQVFDTLEGYEHHYNTQHRHVCSSCRRSFPSGPLLDIHIAEWHDSLFQLLAEKHNMVFGGRLCREVQEQQGEEGALGHRSPLPCRLPLRPAQEAQKWPQAQQLSPRPGGWHTDGCEHRGLTAAPRGPHGSSPQQGQHGGA